MTFPRKVVVIDTVIKGSNHVTINAGLLEMLLYQGASVSLFADQGHANIIVAEIKGDVDVYPITVLSPRKGLREKAVDWRKKITSEKDFFRTMEFNPVIREADLVIFTTITPINFYLHAQSLNKLSKISDVVIGIHGEIEGLFKTTISFKERLFNYFYKQGFSKTPDVKYLFWSPFVLKNVIGKSLLKPSQAFYAYHPLLKIDTTDIIDRLPNKDEPIIFSHLGVASRRKNAQMLFEIGDIISKTNSKDIKIQNIGRVDSGVQALVELNENVIVLSDSNKPISQEEYANYIKSTHFTVSFISGEEYVNRISGSILDTVQYYRPIIALRHAFIEDLFMQAGDIGYLCDSEEEMIEILQRLANRENDLVDRYVRQVENLRSFSENFYCQNNSKIFKTGFNNCSVIKETIL